MSKDKYYCPMRFTNPDLNDDCLQGQCQWWEYEVEECAVYVIARAIRLLNVLAHEQADEDL